jgi:uncharacterized protein YraI
MAKRKAKPEDQPAAVQQPPPKKGRGCIANALIIVVIACSGLMALAAIGNTLPKSPAQPVAVQGTPTWTPEYLSKTPIPSLTFTPSITFTPSKTLPGLPPTNTPRGAAAVPSVTWTPGIIFVTETPTQAQAQAQVVVITSTLPASPATPTLTVVAESLNVRSGPGQNYTVVGSLTKGDAAAIVGKNAASTWWAIQKDTLNGWVIAGDQYDSAQGNLVAVNVLASPPTPEVQAVAPVQSSDQGGSSVSSSGSGAISDTYTKNDDGKGPTAICGDGSKWYGGTVTQGACSKHQGIATKLRP